MEFPYPTEHAHRLLVPTEHFHTLLVPTEHAHTLLVPTEHADTQLVSTEHAHTLLVSTEHAHTLLVSIVHAQKPNGIYSQYLVFIECSIRIYIFLSFLKGGGAGCLPWYVPIKFSTWSTKLKFFPLY